MRTAVLSKTLVKLFCVLLIFSICIHIWNRKRISETSPLPGAINRDRPLILYWDLPWGEDDGYAPQHGEWQGKCQITRDRKDINSIQAELQFTTKGFFSVQFRTKVQFQKQMCSSYSRIVQLITHNIGKLCSI